MQPTAGVRVKRISNVVSLQRIFEGHHSYAMYFAKVCMHLLVICEAGHGEAADSLSASSLQTVREQQRTALIGEQMTNLI